MPRKARHKSENGIYVMMRGIKYSFAILHHFDNMVNVVNNHILNCKIGINIKKALNYR